MDKSGPQMASEKAGRREWLSLVVLAVPTLLTAVDLFVMLMALPKLSTALHANSTDQLWIVDMYGFMVSGFLITMGTLGDRIGRRKILLMGAAGFGTASVLAAFSTSPGMLIAARAMMGIAGAAIGPATLALIIHTFKDAKQRATAISVWLTCLVSGVIIGPVVGGAMLEHFWWGSVFLLGVPAMILLLIFGPLIIPEYRSPEAGRLHWPSVALSLASVLPVIYGLKELARTGWHLFPVVSILVGLAFAVGFIRTQLALKDPLLDMSLFKNRQFSVVLASMLLNTMLPGGTMVLITQHLQLVEGLSPLRAGLWIVPAVLVQIAGFQASPLLARRIRPAYLIAAGLALSVAGLMVLTQVSATSGLLAVVVGFALFNVGSSPLLTLGTNLIMGAVPPEKAGAAAAISQTSNEFGFALGVAVLGSVATIIYRNGVTPAIPAQLSANAASTASQSLNGAVTVASQLPSQAQEAFVASARIAFTNGLHAAAGISAVVLIGVATGLFFTLRKAPVVGEEN